MMDRFRFLSVAVLAALLALAAPAQAGFGTASVGTDTLTFQNGVWPTSAYSGGDATYIATDGGGSIQTYNYGASTLLYVTSDAYATKIHSLLKWNFESFLPSPDSCAVVKAEVWLYRMDQDEIFTSWPQDAFVFKRLMNGWTEGTVNGSDQAGSCDWVHRTASNWLVPGAATPNSLSLPWQPGTEALRDTATAGSDFWGADSVFKSTSTDVAMSYSSINFLNGPFDTAELAGWYVFDVTKQVSLWHSGANQNNGFCVTALEVSAEAGQAEFASDDYPYKARRPMLKITIVDVGAVVAAAAAAAPAGGGTTVLGFPCIPIGTQQ